MQELYDDPSFRRKTYVSHCCLGELRDLKLLCSKYPNDHLIGSVDDEGNTGSLLAATEERGLEVLLWLHGQGDDLTRANHYGRTPLMEAALWGRLEAVQFLIAKEVDLNARDANNMRAMDLAADTQRNIKERATRSSQFYREAPDAGRCREKIRALFNRMAPPPTVSITASRRHTFFDRKQDGSLEILRPRELVAPPVGQLQKAFATLDRGSNYPYVNAMSGFTQAGWPNVLDNKKWTSKAVTLQRLFGLPEIKSDASHVEVQLLAYLFDRHSVFPYARGPFRDRLELSSALPPYMIQPIITISKSKICASCKRFIDKFKEHFPGLHVVLKCVGDNVPEPPRELDVISI